VELQIKKLNSNVPTPFYATDGAAGLDLTADLKEQLEVAVKERTLIPTGLAMAIPDGHVGLIFPRSSVGLKLGIGMPNSVGVIDSDYRGEILVAVVNNSDEVRVIEPGMRIAQLVVVPVPKMDIKIVEELGETERGAGGFGSTGV
jgi:dUTP pyrophosphatase